MLITLVDHAALLLILNTSASYKAKFGLAVSVSVNESPAPTVVPSISKVPAKGLLVDAGFSESWIRIIKVVFGIYGIWKLYKIQPINNFADDGDIKGGGGKNDPPPAGN